MISQLTRKLLLHSFFTLLSTSTVLSFSATTATRINQQATRYQVSIAFSPLVGGPAFLPLHISILLLQQQPQDGRQSKKDSLPLSLKNTEDELDQHRFDFLPVHARDPQVLQKLVSLQYVPGYVRCTTIMEQQDQTMIAFTDTPTSSSKNQTESLQVPTSTSKENDASTSRPSVIVKIGTTHASIEDVHRFCSAYQFSKGDLHLITNNCASFALELLRYIEVDYK